jgi:NADP-dependent 3-hydroxy acid dehydrogenase YdfG
LNPKRFFDVTSGKSIAALREFLKRTYGRLDVLINNAGIIGSGDAAGLKVDMETVRDTRLRAMRRGSLVASSDLLRNQPVAPFGTSHEQNCYCVWL